MFTESRIGKLLICLLSIGILFWILLFVSIYRQSLIDETQKADVILVLGASQWNGKPSPTLQSRLDHALSLYNQGYAPYIILTGGVAEGADISESRVGKNYLVTKGISKNAIFIEEKGLTSFESLNQATSILEENEFGKILLVSHDFHMMRLKEMAKDLKIEQAYASPVTTPKKVNKLKYTIRESMVYAYYSLFPIYDS